MEEQRNQVQSKQPMIQYDEENLGLSNTSIEVMTLSSQRNNVF